MGRAVRKIQELEEEFAAPQGDLTENVGFSRRHATIVLGVFGAICCALAFSALLSHPAGAASPSLFVPGATEGPLVQGVLTGAQSAISTVSTSVVSTSVVSTSAVSTSVEVSPPLTNAASETTAPLISSLHGVNDLRPVQTLKPMVRPAVNSVTETAPPLVTVLSPALGQVIQPGVPFVVPIQLSTVGTRTAGTTIARRSEGSLASSVSPNAPVRSPVPFAPTPQAPVSPNSSATEGSVLVSGSNPLVGNRPLDLLLPAILSVGLILWLGRDSGILLDLRHSPPG